jgi:hypothetical protein
MNLDQGDINDAKRVGRGTWAVPHEFAPCIGNWLHDELPNEVYDPHFFGQYLETTYFDTLSFALRKARKKGDRYCIIRIRCYRERQTDKESYALSAKTENEKFRVAIPTNIAEAAIQGQLSALGQYLPVDILARLMELAGDGPIVPVVTVKALRYAVEDPDERYTLDCGVTTDSGKHLPFGVLEYKSTDTNAQATKPTQLGLRPIKLSKYLWATEV